MKVVIIGRLGGVAKTTKNNQLVVKQADKDKEKDKDKDKDKDKEKDKERESVNKNTHTQFFDFSFYKTNYKDLPDEIKQSTESSLWRLWQQFNTHIDEKCENLRLISQQMDFLEYLEYRQAFIKSGKITVSMCLKIISDLNNHKPASEKYVSVYPALVKWTEQQISFKDS